MDWNYTDIADFYDRVRGLLETVSDSSLPNDKIDMPERAPTAEREVKRLVSRWSTIVSENGDDFQDLQSAVVYRTAMFFEEYANKTTVKRRKVASVDVEYNSDYQPTGRTSSLVSDYEDIIYRLTEGYSTRSLYCMKVTPTNWRRRR